MAGDSDAYRLFLGQVNYWLGKADEGQKLFDALLDNRNQVRFDTSLHDRCALPAQHNPVQIAVLLRVVKGNQCQRCFVFLQISSGNRA